MGNELNNGRPDLNRDSIHNLDNSALEYISGRRKGMEQIMMCLFHSFLVFIGLFITIPVI